MLNIFCGLSLSRFLMICILLLGQHIIYAQNSVEYKEGSKATGPTVSITAGDYSIGFFGRKSWTFGDVTYQGKSILVSKGAHQPVLHEREVPQGVDKFLGTGHRPEQIDQLELIVLDKTGKAIGAYPIESDLVVKEGESYILHKKSKFLSEVGGLYYLHDSQITISPDGIKEDYAFEAVADDYKNVDFIYAFMHMFPKTATKWAAGDDDKVIERGEFIADNSFTLNRDFRFCLVYNPEDRMGTALIYPTIYKGFRKSNTFWNRPRDNKHYLQVEPITKKGARFFYSAQLRAYQVADEKNFELEGKKLVEKEIGREIIF